MLPVASQINPLFRVFVLPLPLVKIRPISFVDAVEPWANLNNVSERITETYDRLTDIEMQRILLEQYE